jgi:hypothetical protein
MFRALLCSSSRGQIVLIQHLVSSLSVDGYRLPADNIVGAIYHKLQTQSSAPEDVRNHRPKYAELFGIINKPLLLHLVGCIYYWPPNV